MLAVFLIHNAARAQAGTITGKVEDAQTGLPLPGANIMLVEPLKGAAAELDGFFAIPAVRSGIYTVRISFVGYRTHEERVTVGLDTLRLDVSLEPDFARHDEIVVTSIATKRSKATADVAVTRIDARHFLENNQYQSVSQLANGKVPGLTVQPATGNVAGGVRMILRTLTGISGNYQPTVYLDGVRIDATEGPSWYVGGQSVSLLAQLNPSDIESIDILKGPAGAALYGTSGSNGVVLITTSKGAYGSPVTADYRFTLGQNSRARAYNAFNASTPGAANAIFRNGILSGHALEIRGGSENVRFFTSYDNRSEDGHIRNNSQDRQSFRANLEAVPSARFRLNASAFYLLNDVFRPYNDNHPNGYTANVTFHSRSYQQADSVAIDALTDLQEHSRYIGHFGATYGPVPRLTVQASVGFDRTEVRNDNFIQAGLRLSGSSEGHRRTANTVTNQTTYNLEGKFSYSISPDLRASTSVGFQAFDRELSGFSVDKAGFTSSLTTSLQAASQFLSSSTFDDASRELGIFATQELNVRDQLFVTLGLRRDFASSVGSDAPSIVYPRASFALRLDRLFRSRHLNLLKLRMAYGEAGQLPDPLSPIPLLWRVRSGPVGPGAVVSRLGNPAIQPERIGEFEVGLELGILDNRLNFDGTYYRQTARNSIFGFRNPPSSGLTASAVPTNVGSAKGWGIETSLSATPIHSRNYGLDATLIWQWQNNELTSLGGAPEVFGSLNFISEGLPIGAFYGWTSRATFDEGDQYAGPELSTGDEDGDGDPDRIFLGAPYPERNGSFLLNFRLFQNFHLSALADWQLDYRLLNGDDSFRIGFGTNARRNLALVQIGAVEDPCQVNLCNDDGRLLPDFNDFDVSAQEIGSDAYRTAAEVVAGTELRVQGFSTLGNFVEDADFIKLRELSVRYDFTDLIRGTSFGRFIRSASFVLAGRNLFTATKFSGPDPEANWNGAFPIFSRSTFGTLPHPRTIYGMFSIGF